jgi:hypothetical protein
MKTLDFLREHFNSYYPLDTNIYSLIFVLMEKNEVNSIEKISEFIDNIESNITKNDISLITNYASNLNNIDFLSRLLLNFMRIFSPNTLRKIVMDEFYKISNYTPVKDKKEEYEIFQYYCPFQNSMFDFQPHYQYKARIFYFIRKQLILCNSKEEMIEKLKHNEEFKFYVTSRFYDKENEIINKMTFEQRVYQVCNEIVYILELEDEEAISNYKKEFENYSRFIKKELGF